MKIKKSAKKPFFFADAKDTLICELSDLSTAMERTPGPVVIADKIQKVKTTFDKHENDIIISIDPRRKG